MSVNAEIVFEEIQDIGELMSINHCFKGKNRFFHIAIIDYLQKWDFSKKTERFAKTVFLGKNGDKLSAIEPNRYSYRFRHFMEKNVFI